MKDMFVNYDNDIDKKVVPPHFHVDKKPKILESLNNISIIHDVLGNEIGIRVKHNTAFNLYFYLDGWVEDTSIDTLVENSQLVFQVFSFRHKLVFEKVVNAAELYDAENNCLALPITQSESEVFDLDSYTTCATLSWPGGKYELFSEKDGLLIFR
jgi:hypothetical protein